MKIQCDVCNTNQALVYCSADEAALCSACDHRVHHANKLAGKHPRFSLLHPPPKDSPVCDICQDKKALLFCQQDRAILCKDCDVAIHKVNQLTQNHNRFVLTGVKLSPTTSLYSCSTPPVNMPGVVVPDRQQKRASSPVVDQTSGYKTTNCQLNGSGHGSTASSISEYLIETLPGWHVEDFLDPRNLSKAGDNDQGPIWGGDLMDGSLNNSLSLESMGIWVPQAPPSVLQQFGPCSNMGFGDEIVNGSSLVFGPVLPLTPTVDRNRTVSRRSKPNSNDYNNLDKITNGVKSSRNWVSDNGNCFMVPQISPSSTTSKRSRTLWP